MILKIISRAVDSSGIIYAGSQNEFGYFAPDPVKGLNYISLSDSLNINDMNFTNVWKVHAFSGGPKGLTVYRNIGSFRRMNLFIDIKDDIVGISGYKSENSDLCLVWIGTRYSGVIRINLHKDLSFKTEHFGAADGLAEGTILPFRHNDSVVFGTIEGLFCFTDENAEGDAE